MDASNLGSADAFDIFHVWGHFEPVQCVECRITILAEMPTIRHRLVPEFGIFCAWSVKVVELRRNLAVPVFRFHINQGFI